ncbi:conserved hypothetical protein [Sporisorium reilianum SRZ2]|uniref:DSC E3 ubiquitin ligase complex subunit 3 C-terminal domain-containing protein n=1 Tax=Sporisorium reilianum (strain SRZ2) TaxID=999809 RepID=E7A0M4_SPORE|nr:conserved hypothetical protein [Sporisorium reilianum SRZ2]
MTQHTHEGHLDLGEGPSSPRLHASIRVRPVTIRFTEPGVRDLTLRLHSLASLRAPDITPNPTPEANEGTGLIFDFDAEQHTAASPPDGPHDRGTHLAREVLDALTAAGLAGDESSRQTLRQLALDADSRNAVDEADEDSEGEQETGGVDEEAETVDGDSLDKRDVSVRELVDWLAAHAEVGTSSTAKGKAREPAYYADTVRVTMRTAPTVYIQCSVGEPAPAPLDTTATAPIDTTTAPTADSPTDADRTRGFNRLLDAGLTPTEISSIRTHFRTTHPLSTPYDLIQAREHTAHLLEMEESWMDTFASPSTLDDAPAAGAYRTVMQGLMVGFFVPPLVPLFWFRDRPHPSSLPSGEGEEDDEQEWENERAAMTRESVLGGTMQIAILFGVVANLIMGVFRFIW